jgi:hypothetical protein
MAIRRMIALQSALTLFIIISNNHRKGQKEALFKIYRKINPKQLPPWPNQEAQKQRLQRQLLKLQHQLKGLYISDSAHPINFSMHAM